MATRKLLLADDSVTIQKVVNLTFADEGIEVIAVGDGDSAMAKLSEIMPDLVMADVNMPGLTGYEVCERIKAHESFRHIPIILLVGSFEPFDEEQARRVGADDFLTKPFQSIRQLVNKVTSLLNAGTRHAKPLAEAISVTDEIAAAQEAADSPRWSELGDAGMDDEMIQTDQINRSALDETAKFQTTEIAEPVDDDFGTQPLSIDDLKEFGLVADVDAEPPENTIENQTPPVVFEEETFEQQSARAADESAAPAEHAALFHLPDNDLLEISLDETDEEITDREAIEPAAPELSELTLESEAAENNDESADETAQYRESAEMTDDDRRANEIVVSENEVIVSEHEIVVGTLTAPAETSENTGALTPTDLSPELLEAVARLVIEKLSDQAIREITREVVSERADSIIREIVEQKLRG